MFPSLRSIDNEAFDLNRIRIYQDEANKGVSETNTTLVGETEVVGIAVPSFTDISTRLDEETEAVGTIEPSIAVGEELQGHGGNLLETPCEQESPFVVVDNEVSKQISPHDASMKEFGIIFDDVRSPVGGEAIHSIASGDEPVSSLDHVPKVNFNSTEGTNGNSPSLDKSSDVIAPKHVDAYASGQILDERCVTECTVRDASTAEDVSGSGIRDQAVDAGVSENVDLDERSDGVREGVVDINISTGHFEDTCSLAVHDVSDSIAIEDKAFPTSDQVVEDCHPDELVISNKDETFNEDVKLDLPYSVEADLNPNITILNEREGLQFWEADPKMIIDSPPIHSEFIDTRSNAVSVFLSQPLSLNFRS